MFKFFILLRRFVPPYKKEVFLSLFFSFLGTFFSLFSFATLIPILQILFDTEKAKAIYKIWQWSDSLKDIFDALKNNINFYIEQMVANAGAGQALMLIALFLVVMTLLKTGCSYLGSYYVIPIRTGVLRDLRKNVYRKILTLPLAFFSEERKGDIISRMTSDVAEIEASIIASLDMIFKNPITIIVYLIVMFAMSWQLTLFVLLLLPVSAYLIGRIGRSLKKRSRQGQEQAGELLSQIEETLGGLRIIKAFNAEEKLNSRFANQNERIRHTFNRINRKYALAHPVSEFLGTVVIAVLLWFGGTLILSNNSPIDAAAFIYYIIIFYSIINPGKELSKGAYSVQKGLASLERVDKILQTESTIQNPEKPLKINAFFDKIEYRSVSFAYENELVVKNVNLTVPKGKTVALVGQSGSGKSTMLDLLPRFYDVIKGEILIDGTNIKDLKMSDLRAQMGNVNQEAILFNDTFFANIAFGVENATLEQVVEAAKIANAHDFITATENGYQTNIGDRGGKLSGGQRQRISIARAILKNPPILILDEATSALDTESEKLVQEALENLMKNRTTLVVAHRLSTITRADEICVMHEGEIVERGTHETLMALDGYYKRLCEMQSF